VIDRNNEEYFRNARERIAYGISHRRPTGGRRFWEFPLNRRVDLLNDRIIDGMDLVPVFPSNVPSPHNALLAMRG